MNGAFPTPPESGTDADRSGENIRRLLLELGADLLGGGLPVNDVEDALRHLGAALGRPDVAVAAFPTGLFVTLERAGTTGFQPTDNPLRFEQTAEILELGQQVRLGRLSTGDALTDLHRIRRSPARWPAWVSDLGAVPVGVGLCILLQPALPNIAVAAAGSLIVAGLSTVARHWAAFRPLLPVAAAFTVSFVMLLAVEASLLDGALRTIVAVLAILLPGGLLVTGLSEIAAGAASAGSARLLSGSVQLVLFLTGVLTAAALLQAPAAALANTYVTSAPGWAMALGVTVTLAGLMIRFNTPLSATPHIVVVAGLTAAVQLTVQSMYGAAVGGLLGAIVAAIAATIAHALPRAPGWQVIYLPAFWVLVPGSFGLINATQMHPGNGLQDLVTAGSAVLAVAIGTLIGSLISRLPLIHHRGVRFL
ncbi:threonine/serine exporter family protein [Kocuria sp. CPCC 205268]|uniref:threonine/serine exporter family protein n=1 Tax=Kocuria oxytropis TaxID=3058913 RepID=UPI0034D5D06F